MRNKLVLVAPLCAFTALLLFASSSLIAAQQKPEKAEPKLSEAEAKAGNAVNAAPDAPAKLAAATEFVKKYPKSSVRQQIAEYVAGQIDLVPDATQKMTLAQEYLKIFTADAEQGAIKPVMLAAYTSSNKLDEAFTLAATMLTKDPEDVFVLVRMTVAGTEAAKRQNVKYLNESSQYGAKAIELIEANKKPAKMDDRTWESHKALLAQLYQNTGVLALVGGKTAEGRTRLEKASTLNPNDPFNYAVVGGLINDEYQNLAKTYKDMPDGPKKTEMLTKITGLLDTIIDHYARVVGLSTGRPEYAALQTQVLEDLTTYYKFRHNQSTEGLQQLLDKYKPKP